MLKKMIVTIIGSIFLAIGINVFLVPHHLLDGGIIGIGLIIKYIWHVKAGLTIILLSIPLYIMAWLYYRPFFYNSLHGLLFSSLMIDIFSVLRGIIILDPMISSVIGGGLVGIGIGIMLREETSTGGTDLLAQFIAKMTNWNVGIIIFIMDALIITVGSFVIDSTSFLYSLIVVTVVGIVTTMLTQTRGWRHHVM
ncbi:YitT family protein [Parageobacillus toebii]|uniref:YitT family protein n=1 Tax=Parageobacillus toebii TaxID=153151 RepID=UPI00196784CF|nr:YitT family protein [Parageobacillus toebii]QSB47536.1 YitT family protein [Parageobacillus toebii]WMT18729.1 YitT family protein [Parageobacillus toebii]